MTMTAPVPAPVRTSWRGLAGLLAAEGISILGSRMSMLAVPWFVLSTTGSAARTGLVAFAEMAPYVVVQALGGPVVDKVGGRRVSIVTDVVAALAIGLVPLLHGLDMLSLVSLCALVALAGAVRGAGDVSRYVVVPGVTRLAGAPLERGAGLADGVNRLAGMIGAPLAGLLVAVWSAPAVLVLDAVTFLVSALVVLVFVPRHLPAPDEPDPAPAQAPAPVGVVAGYVAGLREGFAHLRSDRLLLGIAAMIAVTNLVDQSWSAVLGPVWAQQVTGSPVALGALFGVFGLGAVAGNVVLTWLAPKLPRRAVYAWSFLLCGAPRLAAMALLSTVSPVLVVCFLAGFGAGGINPVLGAVQFERIPTHLQARVLGVVGALAWAGIPLGALLGGLAVEAVGLRPALWAAAAVYLVATLAPFVFPVWEQMERPVAA